ncbi:hypothetical protein [Variovorax sp. J31P207]|uniref:hypothetical protein n=1 Tax=Variovorax sp. J31P207 TaxID=3053510 RepID=UPI002577CB7E|nr:hypothetical protein [Variovorax sp. J31P207]MDM0066783.1 hypothetical protein [Variovorax sp. J31P207]
MTHLRRISVFVDEPDPGHFHWVIHESTEDGSVWLDIESSATSFTSWLEAFDAGCVELFKVVSDERTGPRALGEDEDADPVG